ncbi:hypothetical protein LX36DRAFT_661928 [Colletotrichum falcatum]|nr:hypothetical protein LX36DRAFT_661928 [Colletotrichum falcatum]
MNVQDLDLPCASWRRQGEEHRLPSPPSKEREGKKRKREKKKRREEEECHARGKKSGTPNSYTLSTLSYYDLFLKEYLI